MGFDSLAGSPWYSKKMKKLYFLCGVAFSGKSTLAKKIAEYKNATLVSQDEIWFIKEKELGLDLNSDEDWERVQQISKAKVRDVLLGGESVVYDDICLKYANRESLRNLATECNAIPILIYLDTPRNIQEERRARNAETKERHQVPSHIINWGLEELEIPLEGERPFIYRPESDLEEWLKNLS